MAISRHTEEMLTRRFFVQECAMGLGSMALASLLQNDRARAAATAQENALAAKLAHFAPKAKRVIFLFMGGGPSHLDLFDSKPLLAKYAGQSISDSLLKGADLPFIDRDAGIMASPFKFARHGASGAEISEVMPHLAEVADDIAIIRSVRTDAFNHAPAQILLHTGHLQLGRPSMGAWVDYGLGSEAEDLPAFVVLTPAGGPSGGAALWGNGFLPPKLQGVQLRSQGDPILFASNPPGHTAQMQRESLQTINALNEQHRGLVLDPEISARISAYEMAFRLQSSAPELTDLSHESSQTLEMYGINDGDKPADNAYARSCLLARRLVERGVRFVSLINVDWDHHSSIENSLRKSCARSDRPSAALIKDLKQRGLLDDTLVIWGGEFGRTPMVENNPAIGRSLGRDHHPNAFSIWMAGAGIKAGQTIGVTDDFGYHVVEDPVHVHDVQATILHLLGIDHTKLTYRYQGRNFRLTDVGGVVVDKLLS